MRAKKQSVKLAGIIAALAAALGLLAAIDGASARNRARADLNHIQNTNHAIVAKNDHGGHRHHRHEFTLSRLSDRPVYCNCSYESCPEWVIVQCAGYRPRYVAVRPEKPAPRCICSTSDLTDPNYD